MKDKWPVAYKVAKNYTIDADELNKMSGEVDLDGKPIEDVAAAWIAANEAKWKAWAAVGRSDAEMDERPRPRNGRGRSRPSLRKDRA